MTDTPSLDAEQAHKHFSARCFNAAWDLIDKPQRTAEENEQMVHLAHASLWHWSQRPDVTDKNFSIGYWQASRIYSLLGEAANALKYGRLCLAKTPDDEPFYLGYAYEALARAELVAGNEHEAKTHLAEAWRHAEEVSGDEEKQWLVKDLKSLERP